MKISNFVIWVTSIFILGLQGCANDDSPSANSNDYPGYIVLTPDERTDVKASVKMAYDVMDQLASSTYQHANFTASPLSVAYALAMAANFTSGEAREEVVSKLMPDGGSIETLNIVLQKIAENIAHNCPDSKLVLSNSLWMANGTLFDETVKQTLQKYYGTSCITVEFDSESGAKEINNWISNHTYNLINDFYQPTSQINLMLLNAIYYAGSWDKPFDEPVNGDFTNYDGSRSKAMILKSKQEVAYSRNEIGEYVCLYFDNRNVTFEIFLPTADNIDGIGYDMIDRDNYDCILTGESLVSMPEFSLRTQSSLKNSLQAVGLTKIFDDESSLILSDIVQDAQIQLDHNGVVAAIVSGDRYVTANSPSIEIPDKITIDHPFIFAIDAYGWPLIVGQILEF